jgi:hypothetical protein
MLMHAASSNLFSRISSAALRMIATRLRQPSFSQRRRARWAASMALSTCSALAQVNSPRTTSVSMGEVSTIGGRSERTSLPFTYAGYCLPHSDRTFSRASSKAA